ncbi:MAG TPA: ADP-ribosylglycohydrolase family protein [Verrucomicrobiae bacterium]|nr:ADP-ribosylglycohydrolase family protein [Verrucomicrobiae bacterium]
MKTLLILEDNPDRSAQFRAAIKELGEEWSIQIWPDAPSMIAQCEQYFENAHLISLDHDLNPQPGVTTDPKSGLEVAKFLTSHLPICPVIIHSSNTDASWSMHNEFRFAGWSAERVGPIGEDWILKLWLPKVRQAIANWHGPALFRKQSDHDQRIQRTLVSLEGLAIGDAVGEMLAYRHRDAPETISGGLASGPWFRTDDSEMAISIFEILNLYGHIHQDALARRFAWRFNCDPERGYGKMTRIQLREINAGAKWREMAATAFGGQGSMGNGGAMRIPPLGAYFADNFTRARDEAKLSCEVTHTHPEGIAGAIATAIAAASAWQLRGEKPENRVRALFDAVMQFTPESKVRRGISLASQIPPEIPIEDVAKALGNGSLVLASDTVPYAIWCAAHNLDNYADAISTAISGGGDCDTNAAIVGGIVACFVGQEGIPADWRNQRERFPFEK